MDHSNLIVRTKLAPLRPQKYTLPRPRLTQRLLEARHYRLTIVQAGTGYGKSTALAALTDEPYAFVWYRLDSEDTDRQRLLAHLLHGFAGVLPGLSAAPFAAFAEWSDNRRSTPWTAVVDALINECSRLIPPDDCLFLVLDDAHLLNQAPEPLRILDRLIALAPANLHIILAARYPVPLPSLLGWRVRGDVLQIEQEELVFTPAEIDALFRTRYGHTLTLEQAALLVEKVEGWPIALQLVWRNLQKDAGATFAEAVAQISGSTGDLFTYLTHEVLAQQPADIQEFLRLTSVLQQMTAANCDALRQATDSQQILDYLLENGLFVVEMGDGQLRYHHLFRELLAQQLTPAEAQAAHRRAAAYARQHAQEQAAIYHYFAAEDFEEAAGLLDSLGQGMVRAGRLDTLAGWIERLPAEILDNHPPLLSYLGDIARLHSHFEPALRWYQQAADRSRALGNVVALGQALRGQARVYLDTVNPNQATELLQEALHLSNSLQDRESLARLSELLAENLLNLGRPEEATQYQTQARDLRQGGAGQVELPARILLRTGRLAEARQLLEEQAERERQEPVLRPRGHRETLLLLSLVLAYQGEQEAAMQTAVEGTARGRALHSDFVTAVGWMRQGHAWLLLKNEEGYRQAVRCYQEAIHFSEKLDVPRLRVEASWGLCQAHGFRGDLQTAGQAAAEGIAIAHGVGDDWIEAGIRVVMGAAYFLAGRYDEATTWLDAAGQGFQGCGDPGGETVTRLWQCLTLHQMEETGRLNQELPLLLKVCQTHGYDDLFLRPTLLGPPDTRRMVPLLLYARDAHLESLYADSLLAQLGLSALELHPGYQLRVQTLGAFRLWRGAEEVSHREWQRKKALQLFLLFLTHRDQVLHREQICDLLWPEMSAADALRDFKIAYSAMCGVLEPERKPHAPSAFILRKGVRYGLRPEADLWLDAAEFEQHITQGDALWDRDVATAVSHYQAALALYEGEYLQAHPYDDWASAEQERLLNLYLRTAGRVAQEALARQAWGEVLQIARDMLARDDSWEEAYRLLMLAYEGQGNRAQALRTYERCAATLSEKWGVEPVTETVQTFERIRQTLQN